MVATNIDELPLIGGHRALDLINTVVPRQPAAERRDHLLTPDDLLTWSQRTALVDAAEAAEVAAAWQASPAAARRALAAVKEIREALYEVLSVWLADAQPQTAAEDGLDHISRAWASAVSRARLTPVSKGPGVARWVVGSPPTLLIEDRVAQDAAELLAGIEVARLGRCPVEEGGCGWLFLDHSRNRSRRWCTMQDCGNGAKSRRLTERRRSARAATVRPTRP